MGERHSPSLDTDTFSQQLMGEFLVQQGLISNEQLAEATERLQNAEPPDAIPLGPAFVGSGDGKLLLVVDPRKGTTTHEIALFAGETGNAESQSNGSRYSHGAILLLDPLEHQARLWLPTSHAPRLGLIPTREGSFLYAGEEPRRGYSPRLPYLPSPHVNAPGASGPIDLYAAPHGEYVVAANRGSGTVHVILTGSLEQRGAFSVRAAGHTKGIGVAISPDARTIYLSDGLTPRLAVLDVASFKVRHQLFPTGPLGAIAINPEGNQLLVTFTKGAQEMGLLTLSLPDLRVRHLLNLPGKGEGEHPLLPLVNAPDAAYGYLMAYSYETRDAFYLLAIDRSKNRVIKSQALKEMPLAAGFAAPERWCPEPLDLGDMLLQMGVVAEEHLKYARAQLQGQGEGAPLTLGSVPINPGILSQLPERLIRDRGVIPLNQLDGQLVVAMSNPRDPRARQFVQDLAGDLAVRAIPMSQAEFEVFMEERYPRLMEQFFLQQSGVASDAPAPTPAPPSAPQELTATVPAAAAPTPAPRPQAAAPQPKAPSVKPLALDDWAALPGDRFLMINPLKRQVAELDHTGKAAWLYSPEGDTLTRQMSGYVHAARLTNGHTLIVDAGGHRILEVTPEKQVVWTSAEEAKLKSPRHAVRLASGGTLVTDTGNNRLLELDVHGQATWHYGEMGCSGNGLFKPASAIVLPNGRLLVADAGNHRVIELDADKGVTWQYGNAGNRLGGGQGAGPNQLQEPSYATRLSNGHTLIADAGNHRVIEVDGLGAVVWTYRANQIQSGTGVRDPQLACRQASGHTLIMGRQGVCEVDAELNLIWEYHLVPNSGTSSLRSATGLLRTAPPAAPGQEPPVSPGLRVAAESEVPIGLPEHFLQADRIHHRLWEVNRAKEITWQFTGLGNAGSEKTVLDRPHYAKRLRSGNVLITDSGNHRVLEITPEGTITWEFGERGKLGNGPKHLANPRSAERLTNAHTLIADQSNKRVIEVSLAGEIVWAFEGGTQRLQAPAYATMLISGHLLVVDWGGHIVYEITPAGKVVWSFGQFGRSGPEPGLLFHPEHASRLPNGHTLISDTQNHRVLEVSPEGELVWQYGGEAQFLPRVGRFGMQFLTPIQAYRLPNGHVAIQHAGKGHVVEVDRDLNILFQYAP